MDKLKQAHFFSLPSQGNVYTITNLQQANKTNKLLVASLKRQLFCFEYFENAAGILIPTTKEISFTYIPSGAEIISLDAFNKSDDKNDFVIGITIIKSSSNNTTLETYLNIYSEWEKSEELNIESIAQNCLNVELNFTPYQLTHTYFVTWENDVLHKEIAFILSGSDHQIHVFKENSTNHSYKEIESNDIFPEFTNLPSVVLWIDVFYYKNFAERITAFGCECGYLRLVKVCCKTNTVLFNLSTKFISSISQVKLYESRSNIKVPDCIKQLTVLNKQNDENPNINLLVVNATTLPAVLFKNILKHGLKNYSSLKRTDHLSVSTCVEVADIDFDGEQEILIGNTLEKILLYKSVDTRNILIDVTKIVSPIFKLLYLDLTGDGLKELIVFTMKGIYILQHDSKFVNEALEAKIALLTIPDLRDEIKDY